MENCWVAFDRFSHVFGKWIPIWWRLLFPSTAWGPWSNSLDFGYFSLTTSLWTLRSLPWRSFHPRFSWRPWFFLFFRRLQFFQTNSLKFGSTSTAGWSIRSATLNTISPSWMEFVWSLRSYLKRGNIFFNNGRFINFLLLWSFWLSRRRQWRCWLTVHKIGQLSKRIHLVILYLLWNFILDAAWWHQWGFLSNTIFLSLVPMNIPKSILRGIRMRRRGIWGYWWDVYFVLTLVFDWVSILNTFPHACPLTFFFVNCKDLELGILNHSLCHSLGAVVILFRVL